MEKKKYPLAFIAFLQALGLVAYCSLVATILFNGSKWFEKTPNYFGPLLILTLFTTSALISALIVGSYSFILFFKKKKTKDAIKLVLFTAGWLLIFILAIIFIVVNIG